MRGHIEIEKEILLQDKLPKTLAQEKEKKIKQSKNKNKNKIQVVELLKESSITTSIFRPLISHLLWRWLPSLEQKKKRKFFPSSHLRHRVAHVPPYLGGAWQNTLKAKLIVVTCSTRDYTAFSITFFFLFPALWSSSRLLRWLVKVNFNPHICFS